MLKLWRTASTWRTTLGLTASLVVAACSVVACSDDASSGNDGQGNGGNGEGKEPIYLYQVAVYTPNENFQYDLLRHTLDFNISVDDLKTAREFSAYTGIVVIDGHVIAGDSETPFTTKFRLNDDLSWTPIGEPLNFGRYFTADGDGLNFYFQSVRERHVFLPRRRPSACTGIDRWTIENNHRTPSCRPEPAGLNNTGNRTGVRTSWARHAVLPPHERRDRHAQRRVVDRGLIGDPRGARGDQCRARHAAGDARRGRHATSARRSTRTCALQEGPSCVVKVKADGTLDESFAPNDLRRGRVGSTA